MTSTRSLPNAAVSAWLAACFCALPIACPRVGSGLQHTVALPSTSTVAEASWWTTTATVTELVAS